jgi:general stress protein 26
MHIVTSANFARLITITATGHLRSRPLTVQKATCTGGLWRLLQVSSQTVRDIRLHPQVNVSFPGVAAAFTVAEAAANGGQPNVAANKSANL